MLTATSLTKEPLRRNRESWLLALPFFLLALFPLFWQLTAAPIMLWDEARLAINAAEMLRTGDLLITYFNGEPDLWNTKPPLQIWLIALSVKLFGYNELGLRFPSALQGAVTLLMVFIFAQKVLRSFWAGIASMLVLATSQGYVGMHVTRTGDYDALLVLFTTAYSLLYFWYLEKPKPGLLLTIGILLGLAVLTKSVAGLLCLPALLLYTLAERKVLLVLRQKEFYFAVLVFFSMVASFYLTREMLLPGYLKAVYENELGGRYLEALEDHGYPAGYFVANLAESRLVPWVSVLVLALVLLFRQSDALYRRFALFGTLFILVFLAIISSSQTKLAWYDAPLYPIAALLTGSGIALVLQLMGPALKIKAEKRNWFLAIGIFLIFWLPYKLQLHELLEQKDKALVKYRRTHYGTALKAYTRQAPGQKQITLLCSPDIYNPALQFYKIGYEKAGFTFAEKGGDQVQQLQPEEVVITCEPELLDQVKRKYETETFYASKSCEVLKITLPR